MSADDLGSIWNSDPVRIAQSIKYAGKELDRDKTRQEREKETPEREQDSVEISTETEPKEEPEIVVHETQPESEDLLPGRKLDITIG